MTIITEVKVWPLLLPEASLVDVLVTIIVDSCSELDDGLSVDVLEVENSDDDDDVDVDVDDVEDSDVELDVEVDDLEELVPLGWPI